MIEQRDAPTSEPLPAFRSKLDAIRPTYGFEDVSLAPGTSTIEPNDVELGQSFCGIDLAIRPGETVAVIGATGHGKSTLVNLLTRFYDPDAGTVAIDGHDLRTLTQASLRRQVAVVPQDNVLFSGSIRDNLRLARPAATDAEIDDAVAALGADEVLLALPRGLATPSTSTPNAASSARSSGCAPAAPRSSSPTAWRPSATPTASSSSATASSPSRAPMPS